MRSLGDPLDHIYPLLETRMDQSTSRPGFIHRPNLLTSSGGRDNHARRYQRDDSNESRDDRLLIEIRCLSCHHWQAHYVCVRVETSRRAAKRPSTPEHIHICPGCNALLVLSFLPSLQRPEVKR
jgi:hypothetical protein